MHWLCRSCNTCSACFSQSKSLFSNIMSHVTSCPVSRIPLNYIQLINPSFSGLRYRIRMRLAEERWLCICSHPWKWNGVGESSCKIADHLYTYRWKAKVFKEARLLHQLNHKNVVLFKKVCIAPPAIMLDYVHFDFSPFCPDALRFNCLEDLLSHLDATDAVAQFPLQLKIAEDIVRGLDHLHQSRFPSRPENR